MSGTFEALRMREEEDDIVVSIHEWPPREYLHSNIFPLRLSSSAGSKTCHEFSSQREMDARNP